MITLAHGLGGRSDLPIPLWMALYGGAAALIISFLALGILWVEPRLKGASGGRALPKTIERLADSLATRQVLKIAGLLMLLIVVAALGGGDSSVARNPAPTWFYVWFWVGLVPVSLLLGPLWRLVNPLRTLASLLSVKEEDQTLPYPSRWGFIPAGLWLLVFLWLELVFDRGSAPLVIAIFAVAYSAFNVAGGVRYGQKWFANADGFEVYSTLISKASVFGRRSDGRLVIRSPLDGLDSIKARRGLVFVVCVILGSTAFDGLTRTAWWGSIAEISGNYSYYLGIGTLGLAGSVALVYGIFMSANRIVAGITPDAEGGSLDRRFIHSLIPIAIGYTVAHYFSLLVFQGQAGYILASDPFSQGWDLFGISDWRINYRAVSVFTIAWVQVASIIIGHIVGVIAAHDRAVRLFPDESKMKAQYPLLVAMVVFTLGGISLLVGT